MDEALRALNLPEGFHDVLAKSSEFCKIGAWRHSGGISKKSRNSVEGDDGIHVDG